MCFSLPRKVKKITGTTATMDDGRVIRLGPLHHIHVGDYLEVYADIAVSKIDASEARSIQTAQRKGVNL